MQTAQPALPQAPVSAPGDWLASVPVPIFGAALGLLGLNLLAATNRHLAALPLLAGASLAAGGSVLAGAILVHLLRWATRRAAFMRDLRNVAVAPFFAQIGVALLLLAECLKQINPALAAHAFLAGSGISALLLAYWLGIGWRSRCALAGVSPAWLVPPIGLLYTALLAPGFQRAAWLMPALLAGSGLGLGALGLLYARLRRGPALPAPARPALAIALAIPALMLLVLLELPQTRQSPLAGTLFCLTLGGYCAAALAFFNLARGTFMVSWWAFGMPMIAAAIAFDTFAHVHPTWYFTLIADAAAGLSLALTLAVSVASGAAARRHIGRATQVYPSTGIIK